MIFLSFNTNIIDYHAYGGIVDALDLKPSLEKGTGASPVMRISRSTIGSALCL